MRFFLALILCVGMSMAWSQSAFQENENHIRGETLNYKIKYGWFKIGEAKVHTDSEFHYFDNEPHYLVRFNLKTVGWLRIFADLDILFESYVHADSFMPHTALRSVKTSKKTNIQEDKFFYRDSIYVETFRREKEQTRVTTYPIVGEAFTDALGTYMLIRGRELSDDKEEAARFYIAHRIYEFAMIPEKSSGSDKERFYEVNFPPIKQFPRDKTSYAILGREKNIPIEIKLSTDNGNFYFVLDK